MMRLNSWNDNDQTIFFLNDLWIIRDGRVEVA